MPFTPAVFINIVLTVGQQHSVPPYNNNPFSRAAFCNLMDMITCKALDSMITLARQSFEGWKGSCCAREGGKGSRGGGGGGGG